MGKIMGDAYGDNRFDFYDFIPLLVVLVRAVLTPLFVGIRIGAGITVF